MRPPDTFRSRRAARINLTRHPDTEAARRLTAALAEIVTSHLSRSRPLGSRGLASLTADMGIVLAGLLRPGLAGEPVRAQASSRGSMWLDRPPIGYRRFWALVDALTSAGLVSIRKGVRFDAAGTGGVATLLWPSDALGTMASDHGVTAETRRDDWRANVAILAVPDRRQPDDLVSCKPMNGTPVALTPAMAERMREAAADLALLNQVNGDAGIRGAGRSVALVRRWQHSLAFGGRCYAGFQTLSEPERQRITFDGCPAVEIDLRASQFTIAAGLAGVPLAGDPYAVPGVPRSVTKAWVIQTLGAGRPAARWTDKREKPPLSAAKVRDALLPLYPFLADLAALVPPEAFAGLPVELHPKAAGQWLVAQEAEIVAGTLLDMARASIPVLPVHDSVIVPAQHADIAASSLSRHFQARTGVVPRLTMTGADGVEHVWAGPEATGRAA